MTEYYIAVDFSDVTNEDLKGLLENADIPGVTVGPIPDFDSKAKYVGLDFVVNSESFVKALKVVIDVLEDINPKLVANIDALYRTEPEDPEYHLNLH
jgi:hypothetical protein